MKRLALVLLFSAWAATAQGADIIKALDNTFRSEGAFQRDPNDSGNYWNGVNYGTKYGICAKSYGAYFAKRGKVIKNITLEDAAKIYDADFWGASRCGEWKSQAVAETYFEVAVNAGQGSAARLIQKAVNRASWPKAPIAVDGNIGPATVKRINECNQELLYFHFMGLVYGHYERIVASRPEKRVYVREWATRGARNVVKAVVSREAMRR